MNGKLPNSVWIAGIVSALLGCNSETGTKSPAASNPAPAPNDVSSAVTGEVPADLLESIIGDLIKQENIEREAITVERAESVIWPDGSLGCPKPGEMYTMAQVNGYWVVLRSSGDEFDYRVSSSGHFYRCRNRFKVQNPVG